MMEKPCCSACRFYVPTEEESVGQFGWCHRYPPKLSKKKCDFGYFPKVDAYDWCGEFSHGEQARG